MIESEDKTTQNTRDEQLSLRRIEKILNRHNRVRELQAS